MSYSAWQVPIWGPNGSPSTTARLEKGWEPTLPSSLQWKMPQNFWKKSYPRNLPSFHKWPACKPSPSWNASDLAITLWRMAIKLPVWPWTWTAMPLSKRMQSSWARLPVNRSVQGAGVQWCSCKVVPSFAMVLWEKPWDSQKQLRLVEKTENYHTEFPEVPNFDLQDGFASRSLAPCNAPRACLCLCLVAFHLDAQRVQL